MSRIDELEKSLIEMDGKFSGLVRDMAHLIGDRVGLRKFIEKVGYRLETVEKQIKNIDKYLMARDMGFKEDKSNSKDDLAHTNQQNAQFWFNEASRINALHQLAKENWVSMKDNYEKRIATLESLNADQANRISICNQYCSHAVGCPT